MNLVVWLPSLFALGLALMGLMMARREGAPS